MVQKEAGRDFRRYNATMKPYVEIDGARKTFHLTKKQQKSAHEASPYKVAVNGVSLNVDSGTIYGLLGSNGAGKTTLLRMIATLIKPDEGDIKVNGISILKNPEEVRKIVGFLTSELRLEDFFTPDYLFDFYSDLHGVPLSARKERKKLLFERFGIDEFADIKIGDLSTGMKQKASLAISLVHDPSLVIFDEPTNGLDVLTSKTVTDFLLQEKEKGKTLIVSSHIFSLIDKISDNIGILIDGKLALNGTKDEVKGGEDLEEVFFNLYKAAEDKK